MALEKKAALDTLILKLLNKKNEITIHEIAQNAGLSIEISANRRAIQRTLKKLIEKNTIQAEGKARARVYILKNKLVPADEERDVFNEIPLSENSIELLKYVSKPIHTRKPVGYNQNFLRTYEPNKTSYLSASIRNELLMAGSVENIIRPAGTYARNILNRLLIDLSWNSSRLEGNTYSLLETKRLIEQGENAPGKDATEAQMILNHKDAIEYMVEAANENKTTAHQVCSIHALLSDNLLGDPSASGRVRSIAVGISGTTYIPLDNIHVLKEYCDLFIKKINQIEDPFEQSFFALVHLSYLQAFEDVNKRTARLVSNIPLVKRNLKPLSFIDVNQKDYMMSLIGIYEKNDVSLLRDLYVWAYKRSADRYSAIQQTMGEPNLFKLKYRNNIHEIVRGIIIEKVRGNEVVKTIREKITNLNLPEPEEAQLFQIIETEIMSLHDGNIARFKIRPSEFKEWQNLK